MPLTDYTSYADAQREFPSARLWDLFDGDRERLNIAHECVDRYAADRAASRCASPTPMAAMKRSPSATWPTWSSRFAHWLASKGVAPGDRVAIMLEPSLAFYAALFGAMKLGAVAVPLFTLFGPDGVRLRIDGLHATPAADQRREKANAAELAGPARSSPRTMPCMTRLSGASRPISSRHRGRRPGNLPVYLRHDAGTAGGHPAHAPCRRRGDECSALRHRHASGRPVLLPVLACLGTWALARHAGASCAGHRDRCLCRPVRCGTPVAGAAGFRHHQPVRCRDALSHDEEHPASHRDYRYALRKLSFTGEPIDSDTHGFAERTFGTRLCSMYGTTEVGVILANYPGADGFRRQARLSRQAGARCQRAGATTGRLPVRARGDWRDQGAGATNAWFPTKDRGRIDADGYFFHAGRADDVIISAGWTMSAVEIEDALLAHPAVREAAVIGVPDALRGLVVKAFIVAAGSTLDCRLARACRISCAPA